MSNCHARQRTPAVDPPTGVTLKVAKPNLVAMLLEVGEENAAVLLARSDLPDEIDLDGNVDALLGFGLDRDQLNESARSNPTTGSAGNAATWRRPSRGDGPTSSISG